MTTSATIPNTGTQSAANPLKGLLAYGQSPWMDYIRRDLLTGQLVTGDLVRIGGTPASRLRLTWARLRGLPGRCCGGLSQNVSWW